MFGSLIRMLNRLLAAQVRRELESAVLFPQPD